MITSWIHKIKPCIHKFVTDLLAGNYGLSWKAWPAVPYFCHRKFCWFWFTFNSGENELAVIHKQYKHFMSAFTCFGKVSQRLIFVQHSWSQLPAYLCKLWCLLQCIEKNGPVKEQYRNKTQSSPSLTKVFLPEIVQLSGTIKPGWRVSGRD